MKIAEFTVCHGAHVEIWDDCMAKTPEEEAMVERKQAEALASAKRSIVRQYEGLSVEEINRRVDERLKDVHAMYERWDREREERERIASLRSQ